MTALQSERLTLARPAGPSTNSPCVRTAAIVLVAGAMLSMPALAEPVIGYLGPAGLPPSAFAAADRPVAPIISDRWRAEDERERLGEFGHVADWLGVRPGMVVADIGAGSGYYAVRLAKAVGPSGQVLAQDVVPQYVTALDRRAHQERLGNLTVGQGDPGDPRLPLASVDVAVMVHMYHEIQLPYALLGNLIPALRPGARIGIVDVDDAVERHGTPLATLRCELKAAGFHETGFHWLLVQPPRSEYLAIFTAPPHPVTGEAGRCVP